MMIVEGFSQNNSLGWNVEMKYRVDFLKRNGHLLLYYSNYSPPSILSFTSTAPSQTHTVSLRFWLSNELRQREEKFYLEGVVMVEQGLD